MRTKLEHALAARAQGFDVFPIVENTKVPRIKTWQNQATQDEAQIREWWAEHPNDNIGGATNSLVVADIDPRNGGDETFQALGTIEEFPKTLCNRTQSGGYHLIYAAPDGPVKGGTNKLGPGVDIKARGGYILLPGSEIDGRFYECRGDRPIAPAPQWIVDQCKKARTKTDQAGKRIVEEDETAFEVAEKWMLHQAPYAEFGEIDDTTYRVAARLYDYGLTEQSVLELMEEWNETHCNPPGDMDRLPVVVESAGKNRENAIGSKHPLAPGFEPVEIDESRAPTRTEPERAKPLSGMALERYFDAAGKALSSSAEPLIKGLLDRAAMSIIYGESNTGKTFIAVDIGFHVAASMTWAGRKTRTGCVVYVAAEGGLGVYKRLAALREHYPDVPDVPFFVVRFPIDLLHGAEHASALVKLCREAAEQAGLALELIVIDTLSRAMSGGDENSSTDMGAMVKGFDALREVTGAHLMVIHHSGKDRARGARGHSLLRAATDTEIEVADNQITVTKQRDMDGDFSRGFRLKTVPIGLDADGAVVTSCVVEFIERPAGGVVEVALTGAEIALVRALADSTKTGRKRYFSVEDFREKLQNKAWSFSKANSSVHALLQKLQDSGAVEKIKRDQYVVIETPETPEAPK